jgi:hypothetical protein
MNRDGRPRYRPAGTAARGFRRAHQGRRSARGRGPVPHAVASFRIDSIATATTFDPYGGGFGDVSVTDLDVQAAGAFGPGVAAPEFEPVLVCHYESGVPSLMFAGVGSALNNFTQTSAPLALRGLRDK